MSSGSAFPPDTLSTAKLPSGNADVQSTFTERLGPIVAQLSVEFQKIDVEFYKDPIQGSAALVDRAYEVGRKFLRELLSAVNAAHKEAADASGDILDFYPVNEDLEAVVHRGISTLRSAHREAFARLLSVDKIDTDFVANQDGLRHIALVEARDELSKWLKPSTTTPAYSVQGFTMGEWLGGGAYGEVFRATPTAGSALKGDVAIKVFPQHGLAWSDQTNDRFLREVKALERLNKNRHRAIVEYVGHGFTRDTPQIPYIAFALVSGRSLGEAAPDLPFPRRVEVMLEVLEGLSFAHKNDVLHRDIKPNNIMIREDGQAIIVDFGLAYLFETLTAVELTQVHVGSMGYVPHEVQADPKLKTRQHDIYSCGVTLYQLFAGRLPDQANPSPLSQISSELAGLDRIIRKALAPVADRYASTEEFAADLRSCHTHQETLQSIPPSSRLKTFRDKLIKQSEAANERKRLEDARAQNAKSRLIAHHAILSSAAERAFKEVFAEINAIRPGYKLTGPLWDNSNLPTEVPKGNSLIPYLKIDYPKPAINQPEQTLIFGLTWDMGRWSKGDVFQWEPDKTGVPKGRPFKRPNGQQVLPGWVIYREVRASNPQWHLQGLVQGFTKPVGTNTADPEVTLYRNRMMSEDNKQMYAAELTGPEEAYEYFTYVLTAALS